MIPTRQKCLVSKQCISWDENPVLTTFNTFCEYMYTHIFANTDTLTGADIVEVAPAYDGRGEQTALAAAQVVFEMITSIVKRGLVDMGKTAEKRSVKDEL
jgi:hypothetical protein